MGVAHTTSHASARRSGVLASGSVTVDGYRGRPLGCLYITVEKNMSAVGDGV